MERKAKDLARNFGKFLKKRALQKISRMSDSRSNAGWSALISPRWNEDYNATDLIRSL